MKMADFEAEIVRKARELSALVEGVRAMRRGRHSALVDVGTGMVVVGAHLSRFALTEQRTRAKS